MRIVAYCAGTSLFLGLAFVDYWFLWPPIQAALAPPQDIRAIISLDNRCKLDDDVFIVLVPETGETARFHGNIAHMILSENHTVKLAVSPLYPGFVYDDLAKPVKEKVDLDSKIDDLFG